MWIISQSKKSMTNTDSGTVIGIGSYMKGDPQKLTHYIYVVGGTRNVIGEYPSEEAAMAELEGIQRALRYATNAPTYSMTPGDKIVVENRDAERDQES